MLCLRCRALPSAFKAPAAPIARFQIPRAIQPTPLRTLSTIHTPQQSVLSAIRRPSAFTSPSPSSSLSPSLPLSPSLALQTRSFSASTSLAGKRATYNPSRRVQKRRHGFLARLRSRGGRLIIQRRRAKGRKSLSW
ncbi:mitochondrial 54S ribosomal protein bL34m [Aspergillus candidus]|uniref:Large ribosomal subunit protein bL34m n=1 Tax=Aspergillus candidus TaxID=41067 RepID=A0A2I2F199_ASPCN|nr:ribosomal protein L34-domain-containing protein [Aspergillus candidus]PLB34413.1 ribosomal protein L34-domain-containing protein [Aspergillus candidus]